MIKKGLIIGLCCMLAIAGTACKKEDEYAQFQEIAYSTEQQQVEQTVEIPINFTELQNRNKDIYAWIKIDDTVIDYPIVQSTDDPEDYYLDHTVERKSGLPGAIYTRMTDAKDFSNVLTTIYGHNMKDGSMFKGLHKFEDEEYFNSHRNITIYTPTQALTYEIIAAVKYNDDLISGQFDFNTQDGYNKFIEELKNSRNMSDQFKDDAVINPGEKLVVLSTCIANQPNNRYIVVGVLRDEKKAAA